MENVIVLNARRVEQAQESLRGLRHLHDAGDLRLDAFAVVQRTVDGRIMVLDQVEDVHIRATAAGVVVGAIVGLLSGPLGLLVGGATGAVVGSLVDIADAESSDDVLRSLTAAVPPGRSATIAALMESSPTAVDAMARRLGVAVFRTTRTEIELRIAQAETAMNARRQDQASKRSIGDRLHDIKEATADRH